MARSDKHFRLPEPTIAKLEDLVIPGRRTMTDAVVMAIDLLHDRASHDDAVDLLITELQSLRQEAERQSAILSSMSARVEVVEAVGSRLANFEQSIDRLGEHQVQLAEAISRAIQPSSNGFIGRR